MMTESTNIAATETDSGDTGDDGAGDAGDEALNVAAGGDDAKGKDGKPAEKPAAKVPDATKAELEIKLPEGVKADEAALGRFKALAKESGLDSPKAQKLYDFYLETQREAAKALDAEISQTQKDWAKQLRADPEIGGPALKANFQVAVKAVEKFATPELKAYLQESGLGGHPEIVRLFNRIGKAISEDSIAGGSGEGKGADPATSQDAFLRSFFTHPTSQEALFGKKE